MGTLQGGWLFGKKPEYIAVRMGATSAGQVGLDYVAQLVAQQWRRNLSQDGLGKLHKVEFRTYSGGGGRYIAPSGPRVAHKASLPGMSPAIDTGQGRDSIGIRKVIMPNRPNHQRVFVGTDEAYLVFLEFGIGPGFPFKSPTAGARSSPAKSNVGISASAAGAKTNVITIQPRPHFRPLYNQVFKGVNQDMLIQMGGEMMPHQIRRTDIKSIRRVLLRYAAKLGTLQAIGISTKLSKAIRNQGYNLERMLGSVDALLTSPEAVTRRARNIIIGKQIGGSMNKLIGTGGGIFTKQVRRQARLALGRWAAPLFRF
jgi:hypothetical protein